MLVLNLNLSHAKFSHLFLETGNKPEGDNRPRSETFERHQHRSDGASAEGNHQDCHSKDGHVNTQPRVHRGSKTHPLFFELHDL